MTSRKYRVDHRRITVDGLAVSCVRILKLSFSLTVIGSAVEYLECIKDYNYFLNLTCCSCLVP